MTPEEKGLLEESVRLAKENNKILRGIRRKNRLSSLIHIIYWVLIIGSIIGSYYAIAPYIAPLKEIINTAQNNLGSIQNAINKIPNLPN